MRLLYDNCTLKRKFTLTDNLVNTLVSVFIKRQIYTQKNYKAKAKTDTDRGLTIMTKAKAWSSNVKAKTKDNIFKAKVKANFCQP